MARSDDSAEDAYRLLQPPPDDLLELVPILVAREQGGE